MKINRISKPFLSDFATISTPKTKVRLISRTATRGHFGFEVHHERVVGDLFEIKYAHDALAGLVVENNYSGRIWHYKDLELV